MTPPTILADDLTGACEVAALGFRRGLRSVVALRPTISPSDADLLVIDTETRLDSTEAAAAKIKAALEHLPASANDRMFKKTDSVLRGPVNAELTSVFRTRGFDRVLLVPANPALGRLIREGQYTINGVPLDQTDFADDPHHPVFSADTCRILEAPELLPVHGAASQDENLPAGTLIIGDTASVEDLASWAARVTPDTLPAGGAAFCDALLDRWIGRAGPTQTPSAFPDEHTLLISGTLSKNQRQCLGDARLAGLPIASRPADALDALSLGEFEDRLVFLLARHRRVLAHVEDAEQTAVAPSIVSMALGELTARVLARIQIDHLIIEGGATAAAIALRLGWSRLAVVAEWESGTVSLQPDIPDAPVLTVKPGSYPWPATIADAFFASSHQTTRS